MLMEFIQTFKALSDETRIRILNLLMQRECCVCEIMQALDISQTRASRNLNVLYDAGFLQLRKDGLWSLYSIDREGMKDFMPDLMQAVAKVVEVSPAAEHDVERLKNAERIGPGCAEKVRKEGVK